MSSSHKRAEGETRPFPVMSAQPAVLRPPRRRIIEIAVVYALLPLICAAAGAYIAVAIAGHVTGQRIATLEQDLAERRRQREALDARQQAATAQIRRDACVLADRVQPRDEAVEDFRRRYGCTGNPPSPQPSGTPTARLPDGQPGRPLSPRAPAVPRPAPAPPPSQPKPPVLPPVLPPQDPHRPLLCLPLIGCLL